MTKTDKRALGIVGAIVVAILLFLLLRRGGATAGTVNNYTLPAVTGPSLGPAYGGGAPVTISIPGLNLSGPGLSMIGACCSNCMQSTSQFNQPQYNTGGNTYVFNAADQGPTIYNYAAPSTPYYAPVNVALG